MPTVVYWALSGKKLLQWNSNPEDRIGLMSAELVQIAEIDIHHQILLSQDGIRLDPETTFGNFPVAQSNDLLAVFLFDRRHLATGFIATSTTPQPDLSVHWPVPEAPFRDHPLLQHPIVQVRSLPQYLHDFRRQACLAQALLDAYVRREQYVFITVQEQYMQIAAVEAAVNNLRSHAGYLQTTFKSFCSSEQKQRELHTSALNSFESDLAALRTVELQRELRRGEAETLLDLVCEGKLRREVEKCWTAAEYNNRKVQETAKFVASLTEQLTTRVTGFQSVGLGEAEQFLADAENLSYQQQTVTETLLGDAEQLLEVLNQPSTSQSFSEEMVLLCETRNRDHDQELEQFHLVEVRASECISGLEASQKALSSHMQQALKWVAHLQAQIRDTNSKLSLYSEMLRRETLLFAPLSSIKHMPHAYEAAIPELRRRFVARKRFLARAKLVLSELSQLTENESELRRRFGEQHGQYLPAKLAVILETSAPAVSLQLADGDAKLVGPVEGQEAAWNMTASPDLSATREKFEWGRRRSPSSSPVGPKTQTTLKPPTPTRLTVGSPSHSPSLFRATSEPMKKESILTARVVALEKQLRDATLALQNEQRAREASEQELKSARESVSSIIEKTGVKPNSIGDGLVNQINAILQHYDQNLKQEHELAKRSQAAAVDVESKLDSCTGEVTELRTAFATEQKQASRAYRTLSRENKELAKQAQDLRESEHMWLKTAKRRISLNSFQINDLALFVRLPVRSNQSVRPGKHPLYMPGSPITARPFYQALNRACPHRFLSESSTQELSKRFGPRLPTYVLGVVVSIERITASQPTDPVSQGEIFFSLSIEFVHDVGPMSSGSLSSSASSDTILSRSDI